MPTKWLKERPNGSKNDLGIWFEGPGVEVYCLTIGEYIFLVFIRMDAASLGTTNDLTEESLRLITQW